MTSATAEKELLELENRYWNAIKENDVEAAARLTDFPCIVTGPHGVGRVDKPTFESMMRSDKYRVQRADLSDVQVKLLSEDVAVIAYKVHEELTVEGKAHEIDAADASTWVRRNGRWLCAMHSESISGNPYSQARRDTEAGSSQA